MSNWKKTLDNLLCQVCDVDNGMNNAHRTKDQVDLAYSLQNTIYEIDMFETNFTFRVCDWLNEKQDIFHFWHPRGSFPDNYFYFVDYNNEIYLSFYYKTYFKETWLLPKDLIFAKEIPQEYLDKLKEIVIRKRNYAEYYDTPDTTNNEYVCFLDTFFNRADVVTKDVFDLMYKPVEYCRGTKQECVDKMHELNNRPKPKIIIVGGNKDV